VDWVDLKIFELWVALQSLVERICGVGRGCVGLSVLGRGCVGRFLEVRRFLRRRE
jgi:hypothetical protein